MLLSAALLAFTSQTALAATVADALPTPAARLANVASEPLAVEELLFLGKWSELLDLLPLESLAGVEMGDGQLVLEFDFGRDDSTKLELPSEKRQILKDKRGRFDLNDGSVKSTKSDARDLRVASEVALTYDLETGFTGLREGDVEVRCWGWRAIQLQSFETDLTLAKDDDDHLILLQDANGEPVRKQGQVVPRAHTRWLTITCSGREIRCGLGQPQDGRALVTNGSN